MTARERQLRWAEFAVGFLVAPILLGWLAATGSRMPMFLLLWGAGLAAAAYLMRVAPASLAGRVRHAWRRPELRRIGLQLLVGLALLAGLVACVRPGSFLDLPRTRPTTWVILLGLYPLLSVLPQEILFRSFFFHRYAPLWRSTSAQVLASSLAFGLAHLFYGHWLTVVLSTLGGVFFSWTFVRTRCLALVVAEHSLYGMLLFTIGLEHFFVTEG